MTVATNATSRGGRPMVGVTEAERAIQKRGTIPAMVPLMAKAVEMTVFAGTPSMRVMVKLSAAARNAIPSTVRRSSSVRSARVTMQVKMVRILRQGTLVPAIMTLVWKICGSVTARARGEMISKAAFCSKVLTAKEVINMAVRDFSRTGRKATNSVNRLVNMATTTAKTATDSQGRGVKPVSRYSV